MVIHWDTQLHSVNYLASLPSGERSGPMPLSVPTAPAVTSRRATSRKWFAFPTHYLSRIHYVSLNGRRRIFSELAVVGTTHSGQTHCIGDSLRPSRRPFLEDTANCFRSVSRLIHRWTRRRSSIAVALYGGDTYPGDQDATMIARRVCGRFKLSLAPTLFSPPFRLRVPEPSVVFLGSK